MSEETPESELESWRQVHSTLIEAVKVAEEAVAAQKAQRRYWCEEISGNIDEEGMLQTTSVWKRSVVPVKKQPTKRASAKPTTGKRKKSLEPRPAKKPRKKKAEDEMEILKRSSPGMGKKIASSTPEIPEAEGDEEIRMESNRSPAVLPAHHEYAQEHAPHGSSYHHPHHHHHPPPSQQGGHWGPGAQNLQMMVSMMIQ